MKQGLFPPEIIWESLKFPLLVLRGEHFDDLSKICKNLVMSNLDGSRHTERACIEMVKMERWLINNPKKQKKRYSSFIQNWFENADRYEKRNKAEDTARQRSALPYGHSARSLAGSPVPLKQILSTAQKYARFIACPGCGRSRNVELETPNQIKGLTCTGCGEIFTSYPTNQSKA